MPKRGSKLLGKQKEQEQVQEVQQRTTTAAAKDTHTRRKFLWWPSLRMRSFLTEFK